MDDSNIDMFIQSIFNSKESSWKPSDKISLVNKEIEQRKADLKAFLHKNDVDLSAILKESNELRQESHSLIGDLLECQKEIEVETMAEIARSIEHHVRLSKELEEVKFSIDIVSDATQCSKNLKDFEDAKKQDNLTRAVETVCDLITYLECPSDGFQNMEMYANVKHIALANWESIIADLFLAWDRFISFSTKVGTRKTIVTLKLNMGDDKMHDVLNALEKCKKLPDKISELAKLLMKEFINPIIHQECRVFEESEDVLTLHILHKDKDNNKPKHGDVLSNLRNLFQYLSKKLSIQINNQFTLVQIVGREIQTEFKDTLVNDCLIGTVPNSIFELLNYDETTLEIRDFQKQLAHIQVYPLGSFNILEYVDEIEVIFAKKASQHFLETARTIMLKDLSVTMSIGVESIPEDNETNDVLDETSENALKILDKTIPKSLFYFPRCMISKSAQELLDYVNDMMEQTEECSQMLRKRFYYTTRLVFELYDAVVPYHHEKYLQTIPQYVALFHNNCMYLAHNLQLLGDKWRHMMGADDQAITFLDLVQPLRDLGYRHLAAHLQYQRKQILDNIRSSDLNSMATKDSLGPNAEAAIRQCLRQLALLNSVWVGVLPNNVFTNRKTSTAELLASPKDLHNDRSCASRIQAPPATLTSLMATLTHMFVSELIHRVVSVEDVSAEMASQLTNIYTLVVQKAPALFQNPTDMETHVKSWPKLHELIFVLGGTLKDLEARWAEGSGPLAQHFTTDELRNLIKALFQNTQFRANLLSKIK